MLFSIGLSLGLLVIITLSFALIDFTGLEPLKK